jgi:glycerophosphoryl diester phosphodiesterase
MGVNIIAPPMWMLLTVDEHNNIVPSKYATAAKAAGLAIITWTTERSGRLVEEVLEGRGNHYYYQSTLAALNNDGDILTTIDVLAR